MLLDCVVPLRPLKQDKVLMSVSLIFCEFSTFIVLRFLWKNRNRIIIEMSECFLARETAVARAG